MLEVGLPCIAKESLVVEYYILLMGRSPVFERLTIEIVVFIKDAVGRLLVKTQKQ